MAKKPKWLSPDEPLRHPDHPRPVTRREFIRQGFITGPAAVMGGSLLSMLLNPRFAHATPVVDLTGTDIDTWATNAGCKINSLGAGKVPFICFDLAGGANLAGSNVIVGGPGGQSDFLSTAGYSKLGIPATRVPGQTDSSGAGNGNFTDSTLGLMFHSQSAMLAGILTTFTNASATTGAGVNGFVIPAVSDNDTNTNPHNPMYGIAKAGAKGQLLSLIGSVASVSGGNSMAPTVLIDPSLQPTKISKPSDDLGLVNTGNLSSILTNPVDVVNVMEAVTRISHAQINNGNIRGSLGGLSTQALKDSLTCAYAKSTDIANNFSDPTALDPTIATIANIFAPAGGLNSSTEYLKTASVMKLVIDGMAGAGTITMGGYDYHTGDRKTGELRDLRAGFCIGACLQYAAIKGVPLMVYVFSDGSLFSNGNIDPNSTITDTTSGVSLAPGKGVWTGDNSSTACAFALVYDPSAKPTLRNGNNQIGYFQSTGNVATNSVTTTNKIKITAAGDVNSLVYTVLLNYMALHGEEPNFVSTFPNQTLGTTGAALDDLIAFNQLASVSNGKIV